MSDSTFKPGRWIAAVLALVVLSGAFYFMLKDNMPKGDVRKVEDYIPWKKETLALAETLPVQDGGRVKPLSSYAGFKMLSLHGARSMKIQGKDGVGYKLTPIAWMMDALFRPQLAVKLPTFRVDNSAVLESIGVTPREKRDRYSYEELVKGREKLEELVKTYDAIAKEKRDPLQTQTLDLSQNISEFETLLGNLLFARMSLLSRMEAELHDARAKGIAAPVSVKQLFDKLQEVSIYSSAGPRLLVPLDRATETWPTTGSVISAVVKGESKNPQQDAQDLSNLEGLVISLSHGEDHFAQQLTVMKKDLVQRAVARGDYKHIEAEAKYYRANWFLNALVFYILASVTALVMWGVGRGKVGRIFTFITLGSTLIAVGLSTVAIIQRCLIMERPPVGNLYDTVIFISTTVVLLSLLVELLTQRRLALGLAPMLGMMLILISRLFEVGDAKDNMDPLVAVLASNFWLTIHVLTISLGYSAGLLAAFMSFLYVLMRGLRLDDGDRDLQRSLTRATYGVLCLTLFLSLVGTVLGGIWANYSWGRFWGWDPKENGALLIVLWTLAILHARLGGYLREWGLHFASLFTACVVAFSWWHVNFFNTGLHNYGFTSGKTTIWIFYSIVVTVIIFGVIAMGVEDESKRRKR